MSFRFSSSPVSVEDFVFSVLQSRFPLGIKQLSLFVVKESGRSVSYQAVHKVVTQLSKSGVLEKTGNKYQISSVWIRSKKSEINFIEARYFKKAPDLGLLQQVLFFDSLFEVDKFLIGSFVTIASKIEKKLVLCLVWNHFWIPLFLSKKDYSQLVGFAQKVKTFDISRGNTPIDRWCAKFWKRHGWSTRCGLKVETTADLVVFGDYVIQVFYPLEILRLLDKNYAEIKNVSDLDVDYFFHKVFEKKTRIPIVITKNADLAEQLRTQMKAYFQKVKN